MKTTEITDANVTELFDKISALIEEARQRVSTTVNIAEVYTKYNVGRYIVEDEQEGNYKAGYGKQVLKQISKKLGERFGEGWSVDTLERCRKFYTLYSQPAISAAPLRKLESIVNGRCFRNPQHCCGNSVIISRTPQIRPLMVSLPYSHACQRCQCPQLL